MWPCPASVGSCGAGTWPLPLCGCHFPGACPSHSAAGWGKSEQANGGEGMFRICKWYTSFPSLFRWPVLSHIWGKLQNVLSCENRAWRPSTAFLPPEWMLHWRAESLLPSLPFKVSLLLLVCWMRHLVRWVCACFSIKDYFLLIVTKAHLEGLTKKGSVFLMS